MPGPTIDLILVGRAAMPFHGGTRKIIFVIDKNGSVKSREFRNRVGSGLFKLPEYDGRTNMLCFYSCYKGHLLQAALFLDW